MTGEKIALVGLAAGLVLALVPTWHTYPAGVRGKGVGYVEKQTVMCSYLLVPKNPTVRGYDDECDHARITRGIIVILIVVSGLLMGGVAFAISRTRAQRASADRPRTAR